jgi:LacI family transcriptional regulator
MRIAWYSWGMKSTVQARIAESLQLSQGTVSRALRNRPGIRPEVRVKVLQVANQLGYQLPGWTDDAASTAEEGHFVGILLHAPHDRWRARDGYLSGISAVAPSLDATLVLHHVNTVDCESILLPENQPPVMRRGLMKGVVLLFRWPQNVVRELSRRFSCVSVQHEYPGLPIDVVGANHHQAMNDLMRHLYDQGHRKIGFVGRCSELSWSRTRFAGYVDALCQSGLEYHPERLIEVATMDLEAYERPGNPWAGYVDRIIQQMKQGVTAWMCASDWAGYAVCRGLLDRGVKIPGDVSITGFDALSEPLFGCPLLTAAAVPQQAMGAAALKLVMGRIRQSHEMSHTLFGCTFRQGATTAIAAG